MDDAGNITQDGEEDVDQQVGAATALKENAQGRQDDCENDLANVAGGERHGCDWRSSNGLWCLKTDVRFYFFYNSLYSKI